VVCIERFPRSQTQSDAILLLNLNARGEITTCDYDKEADGGPASTRIEVYSICVYYPMKNQAKLSGSVFRKCKIVQSIVIIIAQSHG